MQTESKLNACQVIFVLNFCKYNQHGGKHMKKREAAIIIVLGLILAAVVGIIYDWQHKEGVKPYGVSIAIVDQSSRIVSWSSVEYDEDAYMEWIAQEEFDSWSNSKVTKQIAAVKAFTNSNNEIFYRYDVEIDQLQADTTYMYRVGSKNGRSESSSFHIYNEEQEFSFLHVTDSQGETEQDFQVWGKTLSVAYKAFPDAQFIVHGGDMVEEPDIEQQWKWFFQYADVLRSLPFMPTIGNHEQLSTKEAEFVTHFKLPNNGAEGIVADTSYYFTYSNMLYISLNTEDDVEKQKDWLEQVLKEQRDQVKWIVVSMHRGVYGASRFNDGDEWVPLFDQYGVDLVLQGHNHEYSRSYPLIDGKVVSDDATLATSGTVYVTLNASGAKFNELKKNKKYQAVHLQNNKQMFGYITVSNENITYQAYDIDGQLIDEFRIE